MATQRPALGKGLASLFPGIQNQAPAQAEAVSVQAAIEAAAPGATVGLEAAVATAGPLEAALSTPSVKTVSENPLAGSVKSTETSPTSAGLSAASLAAAVAYAAAPQTSTKDRHMGISVISIADLDVNPYQPRTEFEEKALEELAQSIRENGIIQPLVVRKTTKGYQLIAGERRLRAAKLAGLAQVPIVIRKTSDKEALEIALIENIQRENLNCIETALAYVQLMKEFALSQDEVAKRVGKDRTSVTNHVRLLRLPDAIIQDLKENTLSFGHGKVLLGLETSEERLILRNEIIDKGLSVREAEAWVQRRKKEPTGAYSGGASADAARNPIKDRLYNLGQELTRKWSTKVEVAGSDSKGKIVIHYHNREQLENLIHNLHNK